MKKTKLKIILSQNLLVTVVTLVVITSSGLWLLKKSFFPGITPIEGLLNQDELIAGDFDFNQITNPRFDITTQQSKNFNYDDSYSEDFTDFKKNSFACTPTGVIGKDSLDFYYGTSKYRERNTKVVFDKDYLLKNIPTTVEEKSHEAQVIFCWTDPDQEIVLSDPDIAILYGGYTTIKQEAKQTFEVYTKNGFKKFTAHFFKDVAPLYFNSDSLLIAVGNYGGGWNDDEVIRVTLSDLSFVNEDNCASTFPRDSENYEYDKNCSSGIEGNAPGSINDFGFERVSSN